MIGGPQCSATVLGLDPERLGDELRCAVGPARSSSIGRAREARRLRAQHRRGRLQPTPSGERRRPHLADRDRLLRLPDAPTAASTRIASRETVRAEQVKMIEIKLSQGAKPGHGGILPAAKVSRRRSPRSAASPIGTDVHLAAGATRPSRRRSGCSSSSRGCASCPAASPSASSSASASRASSCDLQGDARDRHRPRLHHGRRRRGRHRRGADRVLRPRRHSRCARACWSCTTPSSASGCAITSAIAASGKGSAGFDTGASPRARRRRVQRRPAASCSPSAASRRRAATRTAVRSASRPRTSACSAPRGRRQGEARPRLPQHTVEDVADLAAACGLDHPFDFAPHHLYERVSPHQVRRLDEIYEFTEPSQLIDGKPPEQHAGRLGGGPGGSILTRVRTTGSMQSATPSAQITWPTSRMFDLICSQTSANSPLNTSLPVVSA